MIDALTVNLVIFNQISSKFHICFAFIKLSFTFEYIFSLCRTKSKKPVKMAAAYQCHFNQFSSKFHIRIASIKLSFNTFDNFTKAFFQENMHLNINYIISVPPFCNVWYHVVINVTPRCRTNFSNKSGENTRFMLTITRYEIYHANTNNYLHSHTYLHNNTTLGAKEQITWFLSIYIYSCALKQGWAWKKN